MFLLHKRSEKDEHGHTNSMHRLEQEKLELRRKMFDAQVEVQRKFERFEKLQEQL